MKLAIYTAYKYYTNGHVEKLNVNEHYFYNLDDFINVNDLKEKAKYQNCSYISFEREYNNKTIKLKKILKGKGY